MENENNIEILGYIANINNVGETLEKVDNLRENCCDGTLIQLMDADAIAGYSHIQHGVNQALLAFERDDNLAKDLGVEILVRTSGQRQISKAFSKLGLHTGKMNICIVLIDCPDYFIDQLNNMFTREDKVLEPDNEKLLKIYDISQKELDIMDITNILIDKSSKLVVDQ
ncbi:MAG: KEOPS complex subunit Cgi121 [Methanobacteriaceae archaeon]|nr:KEOPS complex subunit Cgi121 [Methanobacteriaceae archaeon]